jgi:hypothetical protein
VRGGNSENSSPTIASFHLSKKLEELAFKQTPTTEEAALAGLLAKLVQDYDDRHHELPE